MIDDTRKAIGLMLLVSLIFATMDALSRTLGGEYSPILVIMWRYWFLAAFVLAVVARKPGGIRAAIRTRAPWTQALRAALLIAEVVVIVTAFVRMGLIATHALFAIYPLLITALSVPLLGERVGWRRWAAVAAGFAGMLVILRPGMQAVSPDAWLALAGALMWALYGVLTRRVSRVDSSTVSFFWGAIGGTAVITVLGLMVWEPIAPRHIPALAALCLAGAVSHWLLIRAYELAEASVLQPFSYTQLVWVTLIAVVLFDERLDLPTLVGVGLIVGAGLFTLLRARAKAAGG